MSKRLELTWPNKDKVLLGLEADGKPIWGTQDDIETRLLVQLEAVGQVNPGSPNDLYAQGDNLLIKGDNLLALKTLERHFAGKIKCIYIDPPFNTGNAFEHYDDGLEHTTWLAMMKSRLELLRRLLRDDGAVAVHIDHGEKHYLKVLMDEVFGRRNFVQEITVEARSPSGYKVVNPGLFTAAEYLLVYAREKSSLTFKTLYKRVPYDKQYSLFIENPDDPPEGWVILKLKDKVAESLGCATPKEAVEDFGKEGFQEKLEAFAIDNAANVARLETIGRKAGKRVLEIKAASAKKPEQVFILQKTNGARSYIWRGGEIVFYSGKVRTVEGQQGPTMMETNIWTDIGWEGIQKEGGVDFKYGKKPEKLVARVVNFLTSHESDWVMDSFLGSGTTCAIAQKLRRHWIGIEIGDQADMHCLPRLKRVVSGDDQTGISKEVRWKGGGGFRYCILGESLFAMDDDTGLVMINPEYTNGPLVAAVCAMEDFQLNDDSVLQGRRGKLYAHVTEEKLTQAYVDELVSRLPETCGLNIYCMKRDRHLELPGDRVKIRRIPKDLRVPPYVRGDGNGKEWPQAPPGPADEEKEPAMKRKPKDPRPLIKLLRNARLKGPKDWATKIDRYVYGPTAGESREEESGKGESK